MDKYIGFYIDRPIGNNIFSYEDRENKKIYVPKLIEGTLDDVSIGEEIVFNEIDEDIEIKAKGLKNMIIYKYQDKDVYIFSLVISFEASKKKFREILKKTKEIFNDVIDSGEL